LKERRKVITIYAKDWTTEQFVEFCVRHNACSEGLAEVKSYASPAVWWASTTCQDWLQWLEGRLYECVAAPAWAEYDRATAPALAEYDRATAAALAEYDRATAPAWAEYDRATAAAWAEYDRAKADAWRAIVPNPFL
jgi:hypothetical protein